MSDIKSVLSLLCQHLNSSINVMMKPEYFRLAKFNGTAENVSGMFWRALNILGCYAAREREIDVDFEQCDIVQTTKLYFAYLQYPAIEFYASTEQSKNTRPLLLAFAWLLGTQNVLNIVVRISLSQSVLGKEFSCSKNPDTREIECNIPESVPGQINNILYLNGKVNYNIKEISELIAERTKLISKAHAASVNVSGLPHLSVSELALIKRIATVNKKAHSSESRRYIEKLSTTATLLDTHMKWVRKGHIFFEWMVTVVEEHNKSLSNNLDNVDWNEVSKFISLLHCTIQKRLETVSPKGDARNSGGNKTNGISRLLQSRDGDTEIKECLSEASVELSKEREDVAKMKEKLSDKLKEVLQSIPSCVQVSF